MTNNSTPEIAKDILEKLKKEYRVNYDEKDAIGRRYRRQDALGTPYCITVDHQSKEDNTFTLRDRDSMIQERLGIDEILEKIESTLSISSWL